MPTYQLQLSFSAPIGEKAPLPMLTTIEAETDGKAVAQAKERVQETASRALHTAILRTSDGRNVWSLRSPEAG